jgi:starch-binding outer membrane protein, SusD/RagB family
MKNISKLIFLIFIVSFTQCTDYLDVPFPTDQLTSETVFQSKSTIEGATIGQYSAYGSLVNMLRYRDFLLLSDEMSYITPPTSGVGDISISNLLPQNAAITEWSTFYNTIHRANQLIEKLPEVPVNILTNDEKKAYLGEAKYIRALSYFTLVTSWGGVPLVTSTKLNDNLNMPRSSESQVYDLIIKDLLDARESFGTTVKVQSNRIHNKFQVEAFLAKVYLYQNKWVDAEKSATEVITSGKYQLLTVLNDVFKRNSKESIFSISETGTSSLQANRSILGWVLLPATAAQATSNANMDRIFTKFNATDLRAKDGNWVTTLFTRKFPTKYIHTATATTATIDANPQDFIMQRLAEIYLIRAEARAQQNNVDGAKADIDVIRKRAGLPNTTASNKENLLLAIEDERLFELFTEGHRWFDLNRTGRADEMLGNLAHKKVNYKPFHKLMPINPTELAANPALTQNPGYQ